MTDSEHIPDSIDLGQARRAALSGHARTGLISGTGKSNVLALLEMWRPVPGLHISGTGKSNVLALLEMWRPVPGASMVEVSTHGRVWSRRTGRMLAQTPNNKGRLRVKYINDAGERVTEQVGPLVLRTYVGPRPRDWRGRSMECCHRNGDKADNWLSNLRWGSEASNRRDRYGERRWWARPFVTLRNWLG